MLESRLRRLIPSEVKKFAKLTQGEPYYFDSWANDRVGKPCMYYWFMARDGVHRYKKRLLISEIRAALDQLQCAGVLTRKSFELVCPTSAAGVSCSFAVFGRILVALNVAIYVGRDGFKLTCASEIANILGANIISP